MIGFAEGGLPGYWWLASGAANISRRCRWGLLNARTAVRAYDGGVLRMGARRAPGGKRTNSRFLLPSALADGSGSNKDRGL